MHEISRPSSQTVNEPHKAVLRDWNMPRFLLQKEKPRSEVLDDHAEGLARGSTIHQPLFWFLVAPEAWVRFVIQMIPVYVVLLTPVHTHAKGGICGKLGVDLLESSEHTLFEQTQILEVMIMAGEEGLHIFLWVKQVPFWGWQRPYRPRPYVCVFLKFKQGVHWGTGFLTHSHMFWFWMRSGVWRYVFVSLWIREPRTSSYANASSWMELLERLFLLDGYPPLQKYSHDESDEWNMLLHNALGGESVHFPCRLIERCPTWSCTTVQSSSTWMSSEGPWKVQKDILDKRNMALFPKVLYNKPWQRTTNKDQQPRNNKQQGRSVKVIFCGHENTLPTHWCIWGHCSWTLCWAPLHRRPALLKIGASGNSQHKNVKLKSHLWNWKLHISNHVI